MANPAPTINHDVKDPATAKRVQQMMEFYPKPPVFDEVPA